MTPTLQERLLDEAAELSRLAVPIYLHANDADRIAQLLRDAASALASPPNRPFFHCQVCKLDGVGVDEDGCCRTCGAMAQPVTRRSAREASEEWHRTMGGTYGPRVSVASDPWAGWLPTPAAINALPEPLRSFIHRLETNVDPAGDQRALVVALDRVNQLSAALASQDDPTPHETTGPETAS